MMLPRRLEANPYPAACTEDWFHELGIRTYVTFETPERRYQRLMAGDYDIVHGQVVATVPDPVDLLTCFSMPPGLTECNWRDEETVRLLAAVNRQRGAERLETVEQIERRVLAAVPAIPLLFERRQTLRAAEVRGWYADPLARQSPRHLWLEPPAPRPART
jgi:ABC-type oligopeptide transport system substrate-binding subunit